MTNNADEKLDSIIRLLEDIFILHALNAKIRRDDIRGIIGVHNTRVSKIFQALKRAKGRSAEE